MVKILDFCLNFIIQHQFWIQVLLIYINCLFASEETQYRSEIMEKSKNIKSTIYLAD